MLWQGGDAPTASLTSDGPIVVFDWDCTITCKCVSLSSTFSPPLSLFGRAAGLISDTPLPDCPCWTHVRHMFKCFSGWQGYAEGFSAFCAERSIPDPLLIPLDFSIIERMEV